MAPPTSDEEPMKSVGGDASRESTDDRCRLAAHEIRSHLSVLNGYLALLEDGSLGSLPTHARSALLPMRAKVTAISRLVDDMLEEARFRDGRLHLSSRPTDLRALVEAAVADARLDLPNRHELRANLPELPVVARVDGRRITTILRNLLDNAIKYSPDGGVIECELTCAPGIARITVRDPGIGIDAADIERLFGRFQRGRASNEGVGLGLYISRTLARLHGGDITVSSAPGAGSEFVVTLSIA